MLISVASYADCAVVITNPKVNNTIIANTCLDFTNTGNSNIQGLCSPEWNGMNVSSQNVAVCPPATQGSCRFTLQLGNESLDYVAHYYNTPYTSTAINREACLQGGGHWLSN